MIVYQDRQRVEVFIRTPDQQWELTVLSIGNYLVLDSLPNGPLVMSFGTIYEGYNPPTRVKESASAYETDVSCTF